MRIPGFLFRRNAPAPIVLPLVANDLPAASVAAVPEQDHAHKPFQTESQALPAVPDELRQFLLLSEEHTKSFALVGYEAAILSREQYEQLKALHVSTRTPYEILVRQSGFLTEEQIAAVEQAMRIDCFVDTRYAGRPSFLTWQQDAIRSGAIVNVNCISAAELEALRIGRRVVSSEERTEHWSMQNLTLAKRMFADAAAHGATDVVVMVRETLTEVQWRIKGDYRTVGGEYSMYHDQGQDFVRAIYTGLATVKDATYNPLEFQNAQIHGNAVDAPGVTSIRIIRGPMYPVESSTFLIARMQYDKERVSAERTPRKLALSSPRIPAGEFRIKGFTPRQMEMCERLVRLPMGVAIITGPTGSGKTTTLFALMRYQAQLFPTKRQITIEDPPEYPQPWAITLSANKKDFREMVEKTLRMDPDYMLLGEIRKADEAVAALQAAMTGHFVWTTLHTTDPYNAITRLEMMDRDRLQKEIICDPELVVAFIAQRIVPVLCPHCSVPLSEHPKRLPSFMQKDIQTWGDISLVRVRALPDTQCPTCQSTGIVDQEAVAEIVLTGETLMDDIIDHGVAPARKAHRAKKTTDNSMLENAMVQVLAGRYDPMDVQQSVHSIQPKGGMADEEDDVA
ncbi:ATPase, T2SS/T4P/T4SS family [Robbsia andropogonis]|uniref:ATPase, T2SS/T4P/T4SS family n=1 Tax=Robbsia andropogonis TaxID=28092 RepID=UPI00158B6FA8|nr:ATPase, T2SS/T4P/T4SS family [Robbsia andropogonis]